MHSIKDIYYNPKFFTDEEIDAFCSKHEVSSTNNWIDAKVTGPQNYNPSFRKTKLKLLSPSSTDYFLMKFVFGVMEANHKKFKKDIKTYLLEALNLLKYTKDLDHFKMHNDNGGAPSKRQLSCIVFLSNEDYYEGGGLVFYGNKNKEGRFRLQTEKGTLIVFPSEMFHEVTPVTNGTRLSLVMWV